LIYTAEGMTRPHAVTEEAVRLEAALLRELAVTWDEIAHNHFKGTLRRPVLALSDGEQRLGEWRRTERAIRVSRHLIANRPWGVVREVLKHEMAHQYVDEVLGIHDQTAHGPAFARVCQAHGFDATAAGVPDAGSAGSAGASSPMQPVLRRITRLLALAESPNVHEAEAAMNEARRLMLLHNIDERHEDDAHHDDTTGGGGGEASVERRGYGYRQIGAVKARTDPSERILAGILSRHFFVSVIWVPSFLAAEGRRGRVLELCGTPGNLDVAAYVHGFLSSTAERLWRAHKRAAGIRSDRERRRFSAGVMTGFDEKLAAGARQSQREGLVIRADVKREAYLRQRYPRVTTRSSSTIQRTQAYEHGRQAGRAIDLQRPVAAGAGGPRMLGPVGR
jgi:hypothetical protein